MSRSDPNQALVAMGEARPTSAATQRIAAGAWAQIERPRRRLMMPVVGGIAVAVAALTIALWPAAPIHQAPGTDLRIGAHRVVPADTAQVRVISDDPSAAIVAVDSGRAAFDIEPLGDGFFRVEAPRARIEVIGTRFAVNAAADCTEITVSEGKVRVTGQARVVSLGRGERARFCDDADAGLTRAGEKSGAAHAQAVETPPVVPPPTPIDAAAGQALVRKALGRIADNAELDAAARDLEQYLRQWPQGVFVEEAMFHTALIAHRQEAPDAHRLAERFLRSFPTGRRADRLRAMAAPVEPAQPERMHR